MQLLTGGVKAGVLMDLVLQTITGKDSSSDQRWSLHAARFKMTTGNRIKEGSFYSMVGIDVGSNFK